MTDERDRTGTERGTTTGGARRWIGGRAAALAVVLAAAVAVLARLYDLGYRVFYYDEAWFGYWTLKYLESGAWEYRPILHGPFFARVNSWVFPALDVDDFTARLVVALVGGCLPLVAWLFRERLSEVEVVALAVVLAANPLLVYYSRFMRKDLPLAAFMLLTLGLLVRAADTRRPRYLYAAGLSLGVAFATKESVLLWVVTWVGAGLLVVDRRLLRARDRGGLEGALRAGTRRAARGLEQWTGHAVGAAVGFLAVVVYFYAPRSPSGEGPGLWRALGGEFGTLPAVVEAATVGSLEEAVDYWVRGSIQEHAYLPYLTDTLETLAAGAPAVCLLAVLGFLYDRYTGEAPRPLVEFNFYAGAAATLGYPLANNLPVPWSTLHAVVPLAVPAAVGTGVLYRWGRSAVGAGASDDRWLAALRAGLAALVLAGLLVNAGLTVQATSYAEPHESPRGDPGSDLIYYAQAPADLRVGVDAIARAAATGGNDTDVLYVGEPLAMDEAAVDEPPATGAWHRRMPLPWYTEALGADVASVTSPGEIGDAPPPVVITTRAQRDAVARRLGEGYDARRYLLDDIGDRQAVFFVREG